jgi:hypothetical protein
LMATPLLKVGILVAKQVTKQLAKQLKPLAERPGRFRNTCNGYGQWHNKWEKTISLKMMGHSVKRVKQLPESEAVLLGYTIASEAFLIVAFSALVGVEYTRKNHVDGIKKEAALEQKHREEAALDSRFLELENDIKQLRMEQVANHSLVMQNLTKLAGADS